MTLGVSDRVVGVVVELVVFAYVRVETEIVRVLEKKGNELEIGI